MINLDIDPPARTREAVKFKDGTYALLVGYDKVLSDVLLFRTAAGLLTRSGLAGVGNVVGALSSLAHQFEQAARGENPQAP